MNVDDDRWGEDDNRRQNEVTSDAELDTQTVGGEDVVPDLAGDPVDLLQPDAAAGDFETEEDLTPDGPDGRGRQEDRRNGWLRNRSAWWWIVGSLGTAFVLAMLFWPRFIEPFRKPIPEEIGGLQVVGFYDEDQEHTQPSALSLLKANKRRLDYLAPFWYKVKSDGSIETRVERDSMAEAMKAGIPIVPLVNNDRGNDAFLHDTAARSRAVRNIARLVRDNNYAGVNIDFQLLKVDSKQELVAFMEELRRALPRGKLLQTSIIPVEQTTAKEETYDYDKLAAAVDNVILMTYDRHGQESDPGPVAPIDWVENSIKIALDRGIPANKIFLGIATYGYDWRVGAKGEKAKIVPMKQVQAERTEKHEFDEKTQSSRFSYNGTDGRHEVWYEDERTVGAKVALAKKYDLRGVAIWRMGYEDQNWWDAFAKALGRK